jgi:acyl carrier protein
MNKATPTDISHVVNDLLYQIVNTWQLEVQVTPNTYLVRDLQFTSMDTVDLLAVIEDHFNTILPFDRLLMAPDGSQRTDLSVSELVGFLCDHSDSLVRHYSLGEN